MLPPALLAYELTEWRDANGTSVSGPPFVLIQWLCCAIREAPSPPERMLCAWLLLVRVLCLLLLAAVLRCINCRKGLLLLLVLCDTA